MNSLVQLLTTCEELLRSVGEVYWADKIEQGIRKCEENRHGCNVDEICSWYGGMGSFNDLIISANNDHILNREDDAKLNDKLNKLRTDIYHEAMRLKV